MTYGKIIYRKLPIKRPGVNTFFKLWRGVNYKLYVNLGEMNKWALIPTKYFIMCVNSDMGVKLVIYGTKVIAPKGSMFTLCKTSSIMTTMMGTVLQKLTKSTLHTMGKHFSMSCHQFRQYQTHSPFALNSSLSLVWWTVR